ncbi:UNVERIFIED_CONTAM: 7-hydroxymethyl chlorophyll a reductase, chloroplastic [Sesamum radiatum]|uniref:7-hydroxymethyl chlorophyll a reductase, chloroplastic n=1 Tax=Sesamum radiatum TaxID=300843 RepID=A0AAW2S7E4_SESRA
MAMASGILSSMPFSLSILSASSTEGTSSKSVKLRDDWRQKSRPVPPGGIYPAKDHCSRCGLCDTYYIAHVKNACAFLGDGMSRVEVLEPAVHGRGRKIDSLDEAYMGVYEDLLYARKTNPVEGFVVRAALLREQSNIDGKNENTSLKKPDQLPKLGKSESALNLQLLLVAKVVVAANPYGAQWTGIVTTIAMEMLRSGMVEAVVCVQSDPDDRFTPRPILASCFDYTNALADMVVGYMGVPKYAGLSMTQHPQYVTIRNERGKEMLNLVKDLLEITPTISSGDRRPFVMETVKADDKAKLGKGPSQTAPKFIGDLIAFILNLIGPKGLEFARYSLDYHTIRNYLHVNRAWGKQRADRHIPSYAKKLVAMYNQNGEIDQMLSAK